MKTVLSVLTVLVGMMVAGNASAHITRWEWREIRDEGRDYRRELRQATSPHSPGGMLVTRQERREIREEGRDLWREFRQAIRH